MKPNILHILRRAAFSAAFLLTSACHAATLVNDSFTDGGITNGGDPQDVSWSVLASSLVSLSTGPYDSAGNTTPSLRFNSNWTGSGGFPIVKGGNFTSQTLQIGEAVTLSFDFHVVSTAIPNDGAALRFGLGSSSNTYAFRIGSGTTAGGSLAVYGVDVMSGTATTLTTAGTPLAINNNSSHNLSLRLARTNANTLAITAAIDGTNTFAATHTGVSNFLFDRILLAEGGVNNLDFNVDNVQVTTAAQTPSLANSGFEIPSTTTYIYSPANAGWSFGGPAGSGAGVQRNGGGWGAPNAPEGLQTAFLQDAGYFEQSINFPAAGTYYLEFKAAYRSHGGFGPGIKIDLNGGQVGANIVPSSTSFATFTSATMNVNAGNNTIRFSGTNPSGDKSAFIDDIRIVAGTGATGPSITSHPQNRTVTAGQTASFSVTAAGTGPLNYQWRKNGSNIGGATSATYTTPATVLADNGSTYTVNVSNSVGNTTSGSATLTVTSGNIPPAITSQPQNRSVVLGQTATFSVSATGTAPLSYQWRKNGTNISGATSASYTTPATVITDNNANFTVTVSNVAGTQVSTPAVLTVTNPGTGTLVVHDSFDGTINSTVSGRTPSPVNLPGGTYVIVSGLSTRLVGGGNPAPQVALEHGGNSVGAAFAKSIVSSGSYTKPARFTISADITSTAGDVYPGLGFWPGAPVQPVGASENRLFTGLRLSMDGSLTLFQNGFPSNTIPYTGTFNRSVLNRLAYDVDTSNGSISNVSLQGSTSDYSAFKSAAFTSANTAYAGVVGLQTIGRDTSAFVDNFKITTNPRASAAPSSPVLLYARAKNNGVELAWRSSGGTYSIYRGTSSTGQAGTPIATGLSSQRYIDNTAVNGTRYYYKIRVTDSYGTSPNSSEVDATPTALFGLRVFTIGHSFHGWCSANIADTAAKAGIVGHVVVGSNLIGSSQVIQHWGFPGVMDALCNQQVDVLTTSPYYAADAGVEKFAELANGNNPNARVTVQEWWMPYDTIEQNPVSPPDRNASTVAYLQSIHSAYFTGMDNYVSTLNTKLGKQVAFIVPVGQAVILLRGHIIAGTAPGIAQQTDLFTDPQNHPGPVIRALSGYCHYAVIYKRNPAGIPKPAELAGFPDGLNTLLQQLAWQAVTSHPLSGVSAP